MTTETKEVDYFRMAAGLRVSHPHFANYSDAIESLAAENAELRARLAEAKQLYEARLVEAQELFEAGKAMNDNVGYDSDTMEIQCDISTNEIDDFRAAMQPFFDEEYRQAIEAT